MAKTASANNLAKFVMDELQAYASALPSDLAEAGKAAGKAAVQQLKADSHKQTGIYSKGWKTKTETTRLGAETVVYQGTRPGLAHLLEFGHPIKSGGRVVGQAKAFPHIAAAEEMAANLYEQELKRRLENGS